MARRSRSGALSAEEIEQKGAKQVLAGVGGILVPGGFGGRGVEGKILAVKHARENNIPYFGICYGMHMAVIEFARNVLDLEGADTTENCPDTKHPVIHLMEEQKRVMNLGGTMRLGAFPCRSAQRIARPQGLRERADQRTPPPPLRIQ